MVARSRNSNSRRPPTVRINHASALDDAMPMAAVRIDPGLRPGLAFMTMHFPDDIDVNVLTIDATDPKSGTAEFKATAIRVEKIRERQTAGVTSSEAWCK